MIGMQSIELFVQCQYLQLGLQIDFEIMASLDAVLGGLAILGHHDDRRLDRGEHGQEQVEEDEGIGIEAIGLGKGHGVQAGPDQEKDEESDDKGPGPPDFRNPVREPFAEGRTRCRIRDRRRVRSGCAPETPGRPAARSPCSLSPSGHRRQGQALSRSPWVDLRHRVGLAASAFVTVAATKLRSPLVANARHRRGSRRRACRSRRRSGARPGS